LTTQSYEDASLHLLRQADDELMAGDFRQAAEKAWDAAAQIIKAVCVSRGWSHQSHAALRRANKRLADELDDKEIRLLFNAAQNLHKSFYEDFYNEAEVSLGIPDVKQLIEKLRPIA
jgi:HEPN domain-containing protein